MIICVGFLTDTHIPFHSRRALGVALNVLADSNLSALYLGGDILDMYWCHGHGPKHPTVKSTLEIERAEGVMFLDLIDQTFPKIPKHFIEGNHETRYERFLVQHAPALFGVTSMRSLLEMDRRKNWRYYDFGPNQLVQIEKTNLFAKHAPKGSSGSTILTHAGCNLIFGHVHRIIQERRVTADRRVLSVTSPGWLGDERRDQVFGYVAGHHNWQTGFARVWIDTSTNAFWIDVHEIKDNRCVVSGRLYR